MKKVSTSFADHDNPFRTVTKPETGSDMLIQPHYTHIMQCRESIDYTPDVDGAMVWLKQTPYHRIPEDEGSVPWTAPGLKTVFALHQLY